jgi:hypothetical protein
MSKLNDLPILDLATASEVYSNDTKVKEYIAKINHRDKVSPYQVWTQTYHVPAWSAVTDQGGLDVGFFIRFPALKEKVTENHGRRFLGGNIFVTRNFCVLNPDEGPVSSGSGFDKIKTEQGGSGQDQVIVSMFRTDNVDLLKGPVLSLAVYAGMPIVAPPYTDKDGNFSLQILDEKASKVDDRDNVEWLVRPKVVQNPEGGVGVNANLSIELPADSQYIGKDEYWQLELQGIDAYGAHLFKGWQGVTVNLRFAALLES